VRRWRWALLSQGAAMTAMATNIVSFAEGEILGSIHVDLGLRFGILGCEKLQGLWTARGEGTRDYAFLRTIFQERVFVMVRLR